VLGKASSHDTEYRNQATHTATQRKLEQILFFGIDNAHITALA
jgi:hypothetical protein